MATPSWEVDSNTVVSPGSTFASGQHKTLSDGTGVANTYCAVCDHAKLNSVIRLAPRGFEQHDRYLLSASARKRFARRGWRFVPSARSHRMETGFVVISQTKQQSFIQGDLAICPARFMESASPVPARIDQRTQLRWRQRRAVKTESREALAEVLQVSDRIGPAEIVNSRSRGRPPTRSTNVAVRFCLTIGLVRNFHAIPL